MAARHYRLIAYAVVIFAAFRPSYAWGQKLSEGFRAAPGYVVDERFSALRREPRLTGRIIERLRLGRFVAVLKTKRVADGVVFCRVATTRRTRGWLNELAVALPSRAGDDQRLLALIEAAEGFTRLHLAHIFVTYFNRSRLRPKVLLILGEEAEEAARHLSEQARKRLSRDPVDSSVSQRHLYLSYEGLDRYNRLGILFDYDAAAGQYIYDGGAYRELMARYPTSEEALKAAERLKRQAGRGSFDGQR